MMAIESIARWQWLLIGAIVGLLLWATHRSSPNELPVDGECINDQATFERRLLTRLGGRPMFKNVQVSRHVIAPPGKPPRIVHVVTGKSCDGIAQPDGNYHWISSFFVATVPYQPATSLRRLSTPTTNASAAWRQIQEPTIIDFLKASHASVGVQYTHAWWVTYPFAAWFGGAVLLIGILWPCLIDWVLYGRLIRPREKPALSLSNVKAVSLSPGPKHEQHAPAAEPSSHKKFHARAEDFYPTEDRTSSPTL